MSILDQIKELEAQKQKLLNKAKNDALDTARQAIAELAALGYNYQIVEGSKSGKRRTGIRQDILSLIKNSDGMSRADVLTACNANDKSSQQSVSNALAALKKSGSIVLNNGVYSTP